MSKLQVDDIVNKDDTGGVGFSKGVVVTGITTATSFDGDLTGNVTGNADTATNAYGLTGSPNISVGKITVGAGQSISPVSETIYYYGDGSNLDNIKSGITTFIASGNISNGDAVIINTNGTVSVVSGVGSLSPHAGTPVVFESANTNYVSATYDSSNQRVVIAYQDTTNSNQGTAVVGTVTGTGVTFGDPVVFENDNTVDISATYDSTNNKVVIAYKDGGNSNYGTAVVGTVTGAAVTFGNPSIFANTDTTDISAVYDSTNQKVVVAYDDNTNNSYGTAVVGTVTGTGVTFGTPVVFESGNAGNVSAVYDSNNQKVVIAYRNNTNNSYGTAIVGTVSGDSIGFGDSRLFESAVVNNISAVYDSTNEKVVIAYQDNANSSYGTAIVGTVSGTTIDFSPPSVFESSNTGDISATYDSANNRVVIAYRDFENSNYGTVIDGVVNSSSVNTLNHNISFGIPTVFETGSTSYVSATYDSTNQKVVVAYEDSGNSSYGTASVITPTNLSSNLSDENYIGIAAEAISDAATGKINIIGGINNGQTGLTVAQTHYVSPIDGSLSVSPYGEGIPGIPIVVAGTAISSTEIVVKDGADSSSTTILGGGSASGGNSGAWTYISQVTVSSAVAQIDFTSNIDSTYDHYVFVGRNVIPNSDAQQLNMRYFTAGGIQEGTFYHYAVNPIYDNTLTRNFGVNQNELRTDNTNAQIAIDNTDADGGTNFEYHLINPANTSYHTMAYGYRYNTNSFQGTNMAFVNFSHKYRFTTAVTGVRFYMSSGDIDAGTITLYGIKES